MKAGGMKVARGFVYTLVREMEKASNQQRRAAERMARERQRELEKAQKAHLRELDKANKEKYVALQIVKAEKMTEELLQSYEIYNTIIQTQLSESSVFDFDLLKKTFVESQFRFDIPYPTKTEPQLKTSSLIPVPKESILEKIMPSKTAKRLAAIKKNEEIISETEKENHEIIHGSEEEHRQSLLDYATKKEEAFAKWRLLDVLHKTMANAENKEIDTWKDAYLLGEAEALNIYIDTVLSFNNYALDTIIEHQAGYNPHTRKMLVDLHLENKENIFQAEGYKYMKQRDEFDTIKIKVGTLNERMKNLMIGVCIATFHVMFRNDVGEHFDSIVVNVYHDHVCCVSGEVEKETFQKHDFSTRSGLAAFIQLQMRVFRQMATGVKPFETLFAELA